MIIAKCDYCGKEGNSAGFVDQIHLIDGDIDLCNECMKIWEDIDYKISKITLEERKKCEKKINETVSKEMEGFLKKVRKN